MKKVLFTATVDSHILHFHIPYLKYFKENGYEVHVATNGDEEIPYCDKKIKISFERNPFKLNNLKAIKQLKKVIMQEKYDIIHTHTPMGSVVTRLAALKARKKYNTRVIYTAHGFHFYKGAPKLNWMLFYPVEKFLSRFTDTLITINQEDYYLAKNKFKCNDVQYVPGVGIDENKFNIKMTKKEKSELRKSLGLKDDDFVMIYPAEISKRKRHIWLVNTLNELLKNNPKIHLLLPGKDSLNGECHKLIDELNLENQIHMLGYRKDIPKLFQISDISISSARQEGLPVNIMEAMYVGLPIVASDCRGNRDLVESNINGYLINLDDSDDFSNKIELLYKDVNKRKELSLGSKDKIKEYMLDNIMKDMVNIYERNTNYKISIIVPIHNSEKYLEKCLDSICGQTYKNLEIILINDNSEDESLNICKKYQRNDKRIILKTVNFSNVSLTRNYGLNLCTGDYITFIDSDDYVEENMYEDLISLILKNDLNMAMCNFIFENESGKVYKNSKIKHIYDNLPLTMYENSGIQGYIWNKIYSRNLIFNNNGFVTFDKKIDIMEDELFNYNVYNLNSKIKLGYLDGKYYHYVKHINSASKSKYNLKNLNFFDVRIKEIDILDQHCINSNYLKCDYVVIFIRDSYLIRKEGLDKIKLFKKYYDKYKKYINEINFFELNFNLKIKYMIAKKIPFIFWIWLRINKKI